ncbi:ribonuclease H-like domain-containing protein, partial [Tanacetum coccineum]
LPTVVLSGKSPYDSHESNEPYDDGRDSVDIGNRYAPNEESEKVSAYITSSTSSRKDTRTKEYATETSISEGMQENATEIPVSEVKIVAVRCILSIAVNNKWPLYQLDINNAFLYVDLEEDVYMNLPEGYSDKGDKRVCKLIKSLYGLKQAPRKWNEKLVYVLNENGFKQSMNDFYLFVKRNKDIVLVLLVYVDDTIVTGNDLSEINKFKRFLSTKFLIKDLGKIKYFLGIEGLDVDNGICLTHRKYCTELLTKFGMLACKPCNTPIEANLENKKVISKFGDDEPLTGDVDKSKHFEIDLYFLREKVAAWFIKPMKVKTEENIADLITKGLCVFDHNKFCSRLGLFNAFQVKSLWGSVEYRLSPKRMGLVDNQAKSELKVFPCLKKED